jgi:hypothetical protein
MKIFLTLVFIGFSTLVIASDTIKFERTFPKVEVEIIRDTFINISNSPLDTFGHRPTFIFIARHYDGFIRKGFHCELYFQNIKDPKSGYLEALDGINDSIRFSTRTYFREGEKYTVKILYSDGRKIDTISLRTLITVDPRSVQTYVYEVKTGMPEYRVHCEISDIRTFPKEQRDMILSFLSSQPRYYFGNERINNYLKNKTTELLNLTEKRAKQINCNCRTGW